MKESQYTHVIHYYRNDSEKRNKVLFDKLGVQEWKASYVLVAVHRSYWKALLQEEDDGTVHQGVLRELGVTGGGIRNWMFFL